MISRNLLEKDGQKPAQKHFYMYNEKHSIDIYLFSKYVLDVKYYNYFYNTIILP